jgi:hypothetical protein
MALAALLLPPKARASKRQRSSSVVTITGIDFGWIGATTACDAVVRKT